MKSWSININKYLKIYLNKFLINFNLVIGKVTCKKKVKFLLKKFKLVSCKYDLKRFGRNGPGGYLLPDDLKNIDYLFSAGIGSDYSFELGLDKVCKKFFMADGTIKPPKLNSKKYSFLNKNIDIRDWKKGIKLETWVKNKILLNNSILKLDIEGDEYKALSIISDQVINKFRIIVLEFHNFERILMKDLYDMYEIVITKLTDNFYPVHIHPNNCTPNSNYENLSFPRTFEITFLNKSRVKNIKKYEYRLGHPLDYDCSNNKSLKIPKIWI